MLVAELDGGIAGYVKLGRRCRSRPSPRARDQGPRRLPGHPRRGVGRALLRAVIAEARDAGARQLTLRVLAHNADARALYTAAASRSRASCAGYFRLDGAYVDDVLMALALTAGG